MNVFFITNVPVPYRMDFFNELGKNCNLTVLFEQTVEEQTHRDSNWFDRKPVTFQAYDLYDHSKRKNPISILRYLRKHKKDIIVVGGYSLWPEMMAILWLYLNHIPFFLSVDGGFIKDEPLWKKTYKRMLVSMADAYLSTSKGTDDFLKYYGANKKIYRIPLSTLYKDEILTVPPSYSEKEKYRAKLGIHENKVIISIGQFIYRKGFDVLMHASCGFSHQVGFYFIGGSPTEEYLQFKKDNGLSNVHFLGFKNKEEIKEYYLAGDVFVFPTREDIWGLVISEAMSFGLPVITTDRCLAGMEMTDESNGRIVHVGDSKALKRAIEDLLGDEKRLCEMGRNSLLKVQNQTIENMAIEHIKIFESIS